MFFRRICKSVRTELCVISGNIPIICLIAFLCCVGGVILWVNCGSTWYILSYAVGENCTFSLTFIFILSCMAYALIGVIMSISWLYTNCRIIEVNKGLILFGTTTLSYLFLLIWYVILFCTHLSFFALILLALSILTVISNLFIIKRIYPLLILLKFVLIAIEILFMIISLYIIW